MKPSEGSTSVANAARRRGFSVLKAACFPVVSLVLLPASSAYAQRVFGLDTSSATGRPTPPTQAQWNNSFNDADGDGIAYKFAIVRSSRGGTVDATRLDDTEFYDNITRATTAGMLAGSYHYTRADVTTHTAADDAAHYLERAGMYMKPGYILPVFDLEAGNTLNTTAQLTAWGMEWMNTIYAAKGILPIVYTNSSYNNDEVTAELAFNNFGSTPKTNPRTYQWLARPAGSLTTGEPGAATNYPNPYGVWDPNFISRTNSRDPAVNPWAFWQNGSGSPNGFLIDFNAANGNIEFVKDFLVPALWTNAGSGDWGTTANWNSDNPAYDGTIQNGPAPRLPNNQNLDWVKLQNPGGGTVTISSGARTVRKFYTQQPLNITGGSLAVAYVPGSGGQFNVPSEFNAAVTLSIGAAYSAHTTQVDGGGGTFNINGGTVTFSDIQLASHTSNSGKIVMGGDATFAQTGGAGTSVIRSTGTLAQPGSISLSAGNRTFTVNNGSAAVDLQMRVGISGAGRLVKSGPGAMLLSNTNTYGGGTSITGGVLQIAFDDRLGAAPTSTQSNHIILDGGTLRTGAQITSAALTFAGSGYTSFPALTINGGGANVLAASANVLAGINSITVTAGGSAYVNQVAAPSPNTAGTFVDVVGGGGTGATAFATVSGGIVTGITITNAGTGYTSMPTINISSTISGGGLAGTGATAAVNGITLQSIALNDGGFDYTTPSITLTGGGGSGATASASTSTSFILLGSRGIQLNAGGGTLEQTAGTTVFYSGVISGSGAFTKNGAGTLSLTGGNTYTGATTVTAGKLSLGSNLTSSSSVSVSGGLLELTSGGGNNRVIKTTSVSVTGTGKLDVRDNKLIVTGAGATGSWTGSNYTGITGLVRSGKGSGNTWNGAVGIVTTQSDAVGSNFTSLGVSLASDARPATVSTTALWGGQTITGTDTLVMYTYGGDATLDGKLNIDDYVRIDQGIAAGLTGWSNGDFNYDGKINIDDYTTVIDSNIGNQTGTFPTASGGIQQVAAVPEPASGGLLIASALAFARRRRRMQGRR